MNTVRQPGITDSAPAAGLKVPSIIVGAALVLWGYQNNLLILGLVLAAVLELARVVRWRWDLQSADFNRLADVTAVVFILVGIYQFDVQAARGIYGMLRWLPVLLFPLLAAQHFSTSDRISYSALFISVRRAIARGSLREPGSVDFSNPYFVACLVSAGGARVDADVYLPAICTLVVLSLWLNRPAAYGRMAGVFAVLLSVAAAFGGTHGVLEARRAIEPMLMDFFQERILAYRDPYRAYTAMGHIGQLKLSDRIVLRLTPSPGQPAPPLLREALYQTLSGNVWIAGGGKFNELTPSADGTVWRLDEPSERYKRTTIARHMVRGKGLIPIPLGTYRIDELPVESLLQNRLGTLKVLEGPEFVEYHVRHRRDGSGNPAPNFADFNMPPDLDDLVTEVGRDIGLEGLPAAQAVAAIQAHFRDGYKYAVTLRRPVRGASPLENFLKHSRVGHCEFYASSTVLLLRAAGIAARYATGYAVSEWSELEKRYVVRRRHAHSWALAFVNGEWIDIDTTPGEWAALEQESSPWWEGGYDFFSWLSYRYARWRWLGTEEGPGALLLWLGIPLVIYLAWRLSSSKRVSRDNDARGSRPFGSIDIAGRDSELLRCIERLAERGFPMRPGESLRAWLGRLTSTGQLSVALTPADALMELHYRYRFDPNGVSPDERDRLRRDSLAWFKHVRTCLAEDGAVHANKSNI